ncbi:undecaprenyl-diphosphatase [Rhodoligotrophos appendicifer]|uniref:undecaprenyl-diphosphate phosphatase n=1 Tax=Rhodoligotrophos appendicifer TaxID=987056 RepID=UPI001186C59B|nr:undecaprenyl-diphosphate phosphatase [Rhodoligotrophos appendicifer]
MEISQYLEALLLGIVEGLTEFIPVSSTGHLILVGSLLGFQGPPGKVFEVVIQLGAILAVVTVYFQKLWAVFIGLPRNILARRFAIAVFLGFLPAAIIGALTHSFIKEMLFNPLVVCVALILGGFAILAVERLVHVVKWDRVEDFPISLSLRIGLFQCLALIPGVSRSGATILGSLMMGVDRRTAAEFSFFVAIPTMLGATVYDLYKNRDVLDVDGLSLILVGFVAAFFAALLVVRSVLAFITRYGFTPFAYYRIGLGSFMLVWFLFLSHIR